MSSADQNALQKRLEGASVHKRGDRVRAVRDLLNLRRSAHDIDTDFQPRFKTGSLAVVDGYEAAWPQPNYRLRLLDDEGFITDYWMIVPPSYIEAAPVRADELSGVDRLFHRLFSTDEG